jgi:hypothetical protein
MSQAMPSSFMNKVDLRGTSVRSSANATTAHRCTPRVQECRGNRSHDES